MSKIIPNTSMNYQRYLFVFAATLLVLLTSCTVKSSIRTLAGFPAKPAHSLPKGHKNLSVNSLEKCVSFEAADAQNVQKISNANDLLPVVLLTAALFFLFSFRTVSQEHIHPLYSGSTKIRNSIPLFLEYRKLLIHFSH